MFQLKHHRVRKPSDLCTINVSGLKFSKVGPASRDVTGPDPEVAPGCLCIVPPESLGTGGWGGVGGGSWGRVCQSLNG